MKKAIIIFTRIPVPGLTKTRMMPFLTGEQCAALHSCFIADIAAACAKVDAEIYVCHAPEGDYAELEKLLGGSYEHFVQTGEGLGIRMANAFAEVFRRGAEAAVLIGTDIPQITPEILEEALDALKTHQIVINPTTDGGYYLIGMKEPHDEVWNVKRYGTNTVITDTRNAMAKAALTVSEGRVLADMDEKEDLAQLYKEIRDTGKPAHTCAFLQQLFS